MRIYKFSQNMNYLVNSLGVNLRISEVILPYLQSMKKIKRSYILRKIKENIELINNSNQLLSNASYLDVLFPFKDKEVKFPDYINKVTDNIEERKWVKYLIDAKKINAQEDLPKIRKLLLNFNSLNSKKKISDFSDDTELFQFVKKNSHSKEIVLPSRGWKFIDKDEVDDVSIKLIEIFEADAMHEIGKNTNWCVAHNMFNHYKPSRFYCFILDGEPKILVHPESGQIKDEGDTALSTYEVKYISGLMEKHKSLLEKRGDSEEDYGDYDIYQSSLNKIKELEDNIDNYEYIKESLASHPNKIFLLPLNKIDRYLSLIDFDKLFKYENIRFLNNKVLDKMGDYINFYDLKAKNFINEYALDIAILEPDKYLKLVPKSFRTKASNIFLNAKVPMDKRRTFFYLYENLPQELKQDPDVFNAFKLRWIKNIKHTTMQKFQLPIEIRDDPEVLEAWKQSYIYLIKSDTIISFSFIPKELRDDRDIINALKIASISYLSKNAIPRQKIIEPFRNDHQILEAWKKGWIEYLGDSYVNKSNIPIEFVNDNDTLAAWKKGWIENIKLYNIKLDEIPQELKDDKDILAEFRNCLIHNLIYGAKSKDSIPLIFQDDPVVLQSWKKGWISFLEDNYSYKEKIPIELQNDKEIIKAFIDGWILYVGRHVLKSEQIPKELLNNSDIYIVWKQKWISHLQTINYDKSKIPKELINDVEILEAWKKGWCESINYYAANLEHIPKELRTDPAILKCMKHGWIDVMNRQLMERENLPENLKDDPEVIRAWRKEWTRRITSYDIKLLKVPLELQRDPEIFEILKRRWINHLKYNHYYPDTIPELLKNDPDILDAIKGKQKTSLNIVNWYKKSQYNESAHYEFYDIVEEKKYHILDEFLKRKDGDIQSWHTLSFNQVAFVWSDYMKLGIVRNDSLVDDMTTKIVENIAKLYINTMWSGHTTDDYNNDEDFGTLSDDEKDEFWFNWIGDNISDYAMDDLVNDAIALIGASTSEEKILIMDRVFNRVHQRFDLSTLFIEGGSESLAKLRDL